MRIGARARCILGALLVATAAPHAAPAQAPRLRTRNVVLIVPDGLRWQEVFNGAADSLIDRRQGVEDTTGMRQLFGGRAPAEARHLLMPFLWETVVRQGQIFGNRARGGDAHITNTMKFSYPGYHEMAAGFADPRIDRNDFGPNPNVTVFEWLARQGDLSGEIAAFATWDAFRDIFARARTGLWVRAGWEAPFPSAVNDRQRVIDDLFRTSTRVWPTNAPDALTHAAAMEYVRTRKPRVLFVGYGETDEWAHARRYDLYLQAAHQVDANIGELWTLMQGMDEYRGTTTFIITTDHGRGSNAANWPDHGRRVDGAENIWIAVIGPDTPPGGEMGGRMVTQSQVAATIAMLLGKDFNAASPQSARPISGITGQ